ncbi:hypothetical protein ABEB36_001323 [Hypothenemus hampei]|uniref:Uncharacterized protein n=1 Tax=Hypothenemus hampei TaxID=57062 RepID=A0ABD1FE75_HYPHA
MDQIQEIIQENNQILQQKMTKTSELVGLYQEKCAKLNKATQAFKQLKEQYISAGSEVNRLKIDNARLSETLEKLQAQYSEVQRQLIESQSNYTKLEQLYERNHIESQLTISDLQQQVEQCTCKNSPVSSNKKASNEIKELKKTCKELKIVEKQLKTDNENLVKKIHKLEKLYLSEKSEITRKLQEAEETLSDQAKLLENMQTPYSNHETEVQQLKSEISSLHIEKNHLKFIEEECRHLRELVKKNRALNTVKCDAYTQIDDFQENYEENQEDLSQIFKDMILTRPVLSPFSASESVINSVSPRKTQSDQPIPDIIVTPPTPIVEKSNSIFNVTRENRVKRIRTKKFWMPFYGVPLVKPKRKLIKPTKVNSKGNLLEALQTLRENNINFAISSEPLRPGTNLSFLATTPRIYVASTTCWKTGCTEGNNQMLLRSMSEDQEPDLLGFFNNQSPQHNQQINNLLQKLLDGIKHIAKKSGCKRSKHKSFNKNSEFASTSESELEILFRKSSEVLNRNRSLTLAARKQLSKNSSFMESDLEDSGLVTGTPNTDSLDFIPPYEIPSKIIETNELSPEKSSLDEYKTLLCPSIISPLSSSNKSTPEETAKILPNFTRQLTDSACHRISFSECSIKQSPQKDVKKHSLTNLSIKTTDSNGTIEDTSLSQLKNKTNGLNPSDTPNKRRKISEVRKSETSHVLNGEVRELRTRKCLTNSITNSTIKPRRTSKINEPHRTIEKELPQSNLNLENSAVAADNDSQFVEQSTLVDNTWSSNLQIPKDVLSDNSELQKTLKHNFDKFKAKHQNTKSRLPKRCTLLKPSYTNSSSTKDVSVVPSSVYTKAKFNACDSLFRDTPSIRNISSNKRINILEHLVLKPDIQSPVDLVSQVIQDMSNTGPAKKAIVQIKRPLIETKIIPDLDDVQFDDSPKSPEPVEELESSIPPQWIPTEKPSVMAPHKATQLLNELMNFPNDDEVVNDVIQKLSFQTKNYISRLIICKLRVDTHDKADNSFPPSPAMTTTQRILMGLLKQLDQSTHPGIIDEFLEMAAIELYSKNRCSLEIIEPITRLYSALCRMRLDFNKLRKFIGECFFFCGDFAVPILYYVLIIWPDVLPSVSSQSSEDPLAKVIVQLCYLKTCNQPGYQLLPLRNLLHKYHQYPSERWNCDEIFEEILTKYIRNPSERFSSFAILIFLKNKSGKWVHNKIQQHLLPLYEKVPTSNPNLKATMLLLLGNIYYSFNKFDEQELSLIVQMQQWLESLKPIESDDIVLKSLEIAIDKLSKRPKVKKVEKDKGSHK